MIVKEAIHEALECGGGICESKWHSVEEVEALMRHKRCFGSIFWTYWDLMVTAEQVE